LALVCQKDANGKDRWVSAVPNPVVVKAGTFCVTKDQTATSTQQTKLVCEPGADGRLRWILVTPGRGEQSRTATPTR
jgi:hypothetical protein